MAGYFGFLRIVSKGADIGFRPVHNVFPGIFASREFHTIYNNCTRIFLGKFLSEKRLDMPLGSGQIAVLQFYGSDRVSG